MPEIKKYDVQYYAGGATAGGYTHRAIVALRKDDGGLLGAAYFLRSAGSLPDSDKQDANGLIYCYYPWEEFPRILDLLRNEKPVYVGYHPGFKMGYISTNMEGVGEGEPV